MNVNQYQSSMEQSNTASSSSQMNTAAPLLPSAKSRPLGSSSSVSGAYVNTEQLVMLEEQEGGLVLQLNHLDVFSFSGHLLLLDGCWAPGWTRRSIGDGQCQVVEVYVKNV